MFVGQASLRLERSLKSLVELTRGRVIDKNTMQKLKRRCVALSRQMAREVSSINSSVDLGVKEITNIYHIKVS